MALWKPFSKKNTSGDKRSTAPSVDTEPAPGDLSPSAEAPPRDVVDPSGSSDGSSSDAALPQPESAPPAEPPGKPKRRGIFGRFKSAVQKTVSVLNTDIRDLVGKEGRLVDDEFLDELFAHLIKTDMGAGPANRIREAVGKEHRARKVTMEQLVATAKDCIKQIMEQESADVAQAGSGPTVIMVVGVNGSGKTTSIAKLAYRYRQAGKKVVLGAGDTFRAAAVEQLAIWAERIGADLVKSEQGKDPASVAYQAVSFASENDCDVCIVDTAGRLQTQSNLMAELSKIRNVMGKVVPEAPHEVLLVLDATAGQNALSQAKGFSEAAGCTGIVLAKLDGTAKGGVAIPIRQEFQLPVKFIGLGETPDAFEKFDVGMYVDALFDLSE